MFNNKKLFVTTIIISITLLLVALFFQLYKGNIVFSTEYVEGKYLIDNKKVVPNNKISLFPGDYTLVATIPDRGQGFFDFEIKPFKETILRVEGLNPVYLELDENIKPELEDRLNIIRKTPIEISFGKIDFSYNTDQFIVTLSQNHTKEEVIDWFLDNGTKESSSNIIWK